MENMVVRLDLKVNEIFYVVPGPVEDWEKR
jgi:hypothetical protein